MAAGAGPRRRLARLPALGLRVGGARPRAAPGEPLAGRRARPRAALGDLRGVDAADRACRRRARDGRPRAEPARALPRHRAEARPDQHLDAGARRPAGRHRRSQLARLQELLQGHAGRPRHRPRPLLDVPRGLPGCVVRGPRRDRRDPPAARAGGRSAHLGRADPFRRRRARAALEAAHGEHQAVPLRPAFEAVRDVRLVREPGRRRLRRRANRAGRGPRAHPVPGIDLPSGHAQRHRPGRLQPAAAAGGPAAEPARPAHRRYGFRWT